jgi:TonB family protein
MRGRNVFALALLFSLAWHIVGGEVFHIAWPEKLPEHKFVAINFWGSLPDARNVNSPEINSEVQATVNNQKDMEFNVLAKEKIPLAELSEKTEPVIASNAAKSDEFAISESINSELKRSVLVKPALPQYPEWAKELGNYFEIELKFLILPDGTVGSVEKVTSAGYPEIDEIGIRYIRKWKFMPLPEGAKTSEQWGTVKLVFKLK